MKMRMLSPLVSLICKRCITLMDCIVGKMSRHGSELGLPYLCISHVYSKNVFVISLGGNKINRDRWKLRLLSLRRRINTIKMRDVLTWTNLLNRLALIVKAYKYF